MAPGILPQLRDTANPLVGKRPLPIGASGFQAGSRLSKARADLGGLLYADGIHDSLFRSAGRTLTSAAPDPSVDPLRRLDRAGQPTGSPFSNPALGEGKPPRVSSRPLQCGGGVPGAGPPEDLNRPREHRPKAKHRFM